MTLYTKDGGHAFHNGITFPLEPCSTCRGTCPTPTACFQPEPEPPKRARRSLLPTTREGWGRLIGGVLGLAGTVFFACAIARHLQLI